MKLSFATLAGSIAAAAAKYQTIPIANSGLAADSPMGRHVLSKARRVEEREGGQGVDMSWVSGYSLKFQGCHHVQQVSLKEWIMHHCSRVFWTSSRILKMTPTSHIIVHGLACFVLFPFNLTLNLLFYACAIIVEWRR